MSTWNAFVINFVSAVMMVALGFFVLRRDSKERQNQLFAVITLTLAFWVFSSAMTDIPASLDRAKFFAELALVGPFLFVPYLVFFVHYFGGERKRLSAASALLWFLPTLLALPFVFTRYNIVSVNRKDWGVDIIPGPLYGALFLFLLFGIVMSSVELSRKYRKAVEAGARAQLKFVFLALFVTVFFGTLANLVMPLMGYGRAAVFGPASTIFFVVFTAYAIFRHHLLDVKVIAAELFAALLTLITFLQVLTSSTTSDFMVRLALFLVTAVFAVLLVKSVLDEVRRREEVQHLAAQLSVSNKRLRQLDDLKTTMVSIASHQIRGPLGGMRGYLTMFRDGDLGPLTDKQKEIVKMNINVLTRLLNAVETFLDITKLEAGKMLLKKETLPLDEAVKDVVDEFRVMAEKKDLRLTYEVAAPRPVWVEFDPEKIKHVIFNLIDNAMKYTEKGSVSVRVKVADKEAVFEVSDTGMGVPPEDLHRLFGKFERGELVVDRGGSGLGLYVVKMLTELQGGRVWVSSPGAGKGATFSVALPLSPHFDPPPAG